jgi:hypothetical protein
MIAILLGIAVGAAYAGFKYHNLTGLYSGVLMGFCAGFLTFGVISASIRVVQCSSEAVGILQNLNAIPGINCKDLSRG